MSATMQTPLTLPCAFVTQMVEAARAAAPAEACGLIAAAAGRAHKLYAIANVDAGIDRYFMDPQALYSAMKEIEDHEWALLAIYHSHPRSPAFPSPTDIQLAFYPDSHYLIISLVEAQAQLRAFRIVSGEVTEVELRVE